MTNIAADKNKKSLNRPSDDIVQSGMLYRIIEDVGLFFQSNTTVTLKAWVDASWLSEENYTSRSGYCLSLTENGAMFYSSSKAQTLASLSSQQSEIIALSECVRSVRQFQIMLKVQIFQLEVF